MIKPIDKIPERARPETKKKRFLKDMQELVASGCAVAELIPSEEDMNVKYPQGITEKYRWAARCCSRDGILITVSMKRDDEKRPHWYAEVSKE